MRHSMTAYAALSGEGAGLSWTWDLRSVNARGLDLRLRLAEGTDTLEPAVRKRLSAALSRGSVNATLRVVQAGPAEGEGLDLDQLDRVISRLAAIEGRAAARGLTLAPVSPADILAQRGILETTGDGLSDAAASHIMAGLEAAIAELIEMRAREGAQLATLLGGHLDTLERLIADARDAARHQAEAAPALLEAAIARTTATAPAFDPVRLAQEVALIVTRGDVTEELDRLDGHVEAARALLAGEGAAGRKLDFLAQEFNREANTLCSKSQSAALTRIGLALKAAIEQMREQIQNVE